MTIKAAQLAGAETLLKSALDLIIDAASFLTEGGDEDSANSLRRVGREVQSSFEQLRIKRREAEAREKANESS